MTTLEDRFAIRDLQERYATESDFNNQDYYASIFRPDVKLRVYFYGKLGTQADSVDDMIRQYKAFGVNNKVWESIELGNFFRINRCYFESSDKNMELVSLLKRFTAKVNTEVERETKDNGSVTDVYRKVVESNLPEAFQVRIPVFKGAAPETFKIEIIAHVEGKHAVLELVSPDAEQIVEEVRDKLIDAEIAKIRELAPEIPIIEV